MTRPILHAQVREPLTRGIPTHDAILSPPTEAEREAWYAQTARMAALDLGTVYTGISKLIGSLKAEDRETVLKRLDAQREIGWEQTPNPKGQPSAGSGMHDSVKDHSLRDMRDSTGAINRSLNASARERWAGR